MVAHIQNLFTHVLRHAGNGHNTSTCNPAQSCCNKHQLSENIMVCFKQNQITGFNELKRELMYCCHGAKHLVIAAARPIYKLLIRYYKHLLEQLAALEQLGKG